MFSILTRNKKIILAIAAILILTVAGYFLYQKFFQAPGRGGEKSVHELLVQIQIPKGNPEDLKEQYERGDVISVSSREKGWSLAEKESFLQVKANLTEKQAALLMQPLQVERKQETRNTEQAGKAGLSSGQSPALDKQMETVKLRRYGINLEKIGVAPDDEKGQAIDKVFEDGIIFEKDN